jgi:uncharacterized protein (TIGR03435 family)
MCKLTFGLLPIVVGIATAQPTTKPQASPEAGASFEVASIKYHPGPIRYSADPSVHGRRVIGTASTLLDLITSSYDVRYDQISGGPKWANSDAYDIEAKAEGEGTLTREEARRMMQSLLADRFHVKIHREAREVPVYALVLSKNGHKMKESSADAPGNSVRVNKSGVHMEASRGNMEYLASQLSHTAGRPVVDKTGLTGYYAFTFDWIPADRAPESDSDTPSMFTAIQEQLGLKLEPTKAPREILVIDHAEKPSEN